MERSPSISIQFQPSRAPFKDEIMICVIESALSSELVAKVSESATQSWCFLRSKFYIFKINFTKLQTFPHTPLTLTRYHKIWSISSYNFRSAGAILLEYHKIQFRSSLEDVQWTRGILIELNRFYGVSNTQKLLVLLLEYTCSVHQNLIAKDLSSW